MQNNWYYAKSPIMLNQIVDPIQVMPTVCQISNSFLAAEKEKKMPDLASKTPEWQHCVENIPKTVNTHKAIKTLFI